MAVLGPLSRIGFLGRLSPEVAAAVAEGGQLTEYPARAVTFVGDDTVSGGVAVRGLQRVYLVGPDGRQLTIRYVYRGELLGAIRLPSVHVSIATQALEKAAVFHFQPGRLGLLSQQYPQLATALMDEYAERLARGYRALGMHAFTGVKPRVAQDLYWRAEAQGVTNAVIHATQQDLADSIGSVREVVARALDELEQDGVIERSRGAIVVVDPDRLFVEARC